MFRSKQPSLTLFVVSLGALLLVSSCRSTPDMKQNALSEDLDVMRSAIDQFSQDRGHVPKALRDLISAGYIKDIPVDPVTGSNKTWLCLIDDEDNSGDLGIVDIASGSETPDSDEGTYIKCP